MPENYYLSLSGSAPSGESFDVSLQYSNEGAWSAEHRIETLAKAAVVLTRAVLISDPRDVEGAADEVA